MSDTPGVKVTITYCAECGYEPQTLALTEALMKAFTHQLTAIELVPWYEGSFVRSPKRTAAIRPTIPSTNPNNPSRFCIIFLDPHRNDVVPRQIDRLVAPGGAGGPDLART